MVKKCSYKVGGNKNRQREERMYRKRRQREMKEKELKCV